MGIKSIALAATTFILSTCVNAAYIAFEYSGASQQFIVPTGVTSLNILAIGGGGGGANGHQGGGGSGNVVIGTYAVNAGDVFSVNVGMGGAGALDAINSNNIIGLTAGTASSFGNIISVSGGGIVAGANQGGHNGSSGGGAACNAGSLGGAGGAGGSDGQACQSGSSMPIGLGQGDYTSLLSLFTDNSITAGAGGVGGTGSNAGGGGAGGILINGLGLNAQSGNQSWSGQGGLGYGSGGGAGGLDANISGTRFGGGDGANGLIYVEYASAVPVPAAVWLFGSGLIGLIGIARRKKA